MTETPPRATGEVALVGGGPGAPELLTLAAVTALREADVVLYDRLAPPVLAEFAPQAEHVDVGKRPGHHQLSQSGIEALLITQAQAGRKVVRLKGGDAFVFGRGGEEVRACRDAGVTVRVIPGVTSAIAVPAAVGIPLTHREVSRMFTVVSGHAPLTAAELDHLAGLARTGGTLVILMGVLHLAQICQGLAAAGLPPGTPVAIIEQGYSPHQRLLTTTVASIAVTAAEHAVRSPAVIVIGEVVRLADQDPAAAADLHRAADLS